MSRTWRAGTFFLFSRKPQREHVHKFERRDWDIEARLEDWEAEAAIMKSVKEKIIRHIGPALELGSGRVLGPTNGRD